MIDLRKAALAALEAVDDYLSRIEGDDSGPSHTINLIRAALAQPEAKPVARVAEVHMSRYTVEWTNGPLPEGTLLYTTHSTLVQPNPRPLTDEQIEQMARQAFDERHTGAVERMRQLQATIKERDALRLDAERYRWLRANHLQVGPDAWIRTGADLEEAIDTAMKEKP